VSKTEISFLSEKAINNLSTKRLLAYYQKSYKKFQKHYFICCDCCGAPVWVLYSKDKYNQQLKEKYEFAKQYLKKLKEVLNQREHIKR